MYGKQEGQTPLSSLPSPPPPPPHARGHRKLTLHLLCLNPWIARFTFHSILLINLMTEINNIHVKIGDLMQVLLTNIKTSHNAMPWQAAQQIAGV